MGKESEAKRALFSLCRGGDGERSVPGRAATLSARQGRQVERATVLLAARDPCSSSFLFTSPFPVLALERNALPWWFAPGGVDSPPTAVVPSGQTVQNSFKGKDSQRRPSPRPAVWGSPARREQNLQGPLQSRRLARESPRLPSFLHLWMMRL